MNELEKRTEEKNQTVQPACNISEENGEVRLSLEMPGVDKDGIEVSLEKNELIIQGRRSDAAPLGNFLIRERRRGDYRKRFIIDETIDREKIQAVVVDGVLTLTLATKESAKPKKIEIR